MSAELAMALADARRFQEELASALVRRDDLLAQRDDLRALVEEAWGVIANASGGDWSKQSAEWQEAARRWEQRAHPRPTILVHRLDDAGNIVASRRQAVTP